MKNAFTSYHKFDNFIKMQLLAHGVAMFSWSLVIPIIVKLQGLLWATSLISAVMILNQMSSFICPLLKNISVKKSYGLIIILTVLYEFSLPLYFVDVQTFLMTDVFLEFLFATAVSNYVINYNAFIMERYNTDIFKDVQYYKNMICSIATIIGFTIVSVMDLLFKTYEITIICFMVMIFISICVEIYNYKAYWTDI